MDRGKFFVSEEAFGEKAGEYKNTVKRRLREVLKENPELITVTKTGILHRFSLKIFF